MKPLRDYVVYTVMKTTNERPALSKALTAYIKRTSLYAIYIWFSPIKDLTLSYWLRLKFSQLFYLKRILSAAPIEVSSGSVEVHMLLNHKRIYEGLWALYSLLFFSNINMRITIHDDGTLKESDRVSLKRLFVGIRIIDRKESDERLGRYFEQNSLENCQKLRETLIFGLKLFDPCIFCTSKHMILMDSDVLFYKKPVFLKQNLENNTDVNLYSLDNQYVYSISEDDARTLIGKPIIQRFNPGLVKLSSGMVDFRHIEKYLEHPGFWTSGGTAGYFTELTIWALELSRYESQPLPSDYAICAPDPKDFTFGHYCGGGYWSTFFYTKGVPYLSKRIFDKTPPLERSER